MGFNAPSNVTFKRAKVTPLALEEPQEQPTAAAAKRRSPKRDASEFVAGVLSSQYESRRHHLNFLNAFCGICRAHGRGGRATLPFLKEAVALKVKEIMMDSFFFLMEPKFLLAMRAMGELRVCGRKGLHQMHLAFLREDPSADNFFTLIDVSAPERCRRYGLSPRAMEQGKKSGAAPSS
ncbi:UNVERIFIED_CONTAM: hypothetical protein K2H54_039775 [Gekko kuhli]